MRISRTPPIFPTSMRRSGSFPGREPCLHSERFLWESLVPRLIPPAQLAIIEALRAGQPLSEDELLSLLELDGSVGQEPLAHHLKSMVCAGVLVVVDDRPMSHGAGEAKPCYALTPVGSDGRSELTASGPSAREVPITIGANQRNALYQLLLSDLSSFGDLQAAYARGKQVDLEECYRLGRRVTDCMRLIQDGGLGWGDETAEGAVPLTLPDEELRRILIAQRDQLLAHREATRPEREEIEAELDLDATALSGCQAALAQIAGE